MRPPSQEQHFKSDHYLCPHPDCLAQKFVVFESELDLQAHALEVHGVGSSVDQKARKEARRIETSFTYSTGETSRGATNDGGAGAGRRRAAGGRAPVASFVEPAREDPVQTPRGERRVPGLGAIQALGSGSGAAGGSGSNSRAARFGGQLTPDPASTPLSRSGASTPTPTSGSESHDAATLERHAALMRRVQDAANGHEGKIAGFKFAVRSYRAGELGARDLCDQLYNIFDQRTDEAGKIVLAFADLLEEEDKKRSLRNAWREMSSEVSCFLMSFLSVSVSFSADEARDTFKESSSSSQNEFDFLAEPVPFPHRARSDSERRPDPGQQHLAAGPLCSTPQRRQPVFNLGPSRAGRALERSRARRAAVEPVPSVDGGQQCARDPGAEQGRVAEEEERRWRWHRLVECCECRNEAEPVHFGNAAQCWIGVPDPRRRRLFQQLFSSDQSCRIGRSPFFGEQARVRFRRQFARRRLHPASSERPRIPVPPRIQLGSRPSRSYARRVGETGRTDGP